jgi:hypothetical protein
MLQVGNRYSKAVTKYMGKVTGEGQNNQDNMYDSLEAAYKYVSTFVTEATLGFAGKRNRDDDVDTSGRIPGRRALVVKKDHKRKSEAGSKGSGAASDTKVADGKGLRPCWVCVFQIKDVVKDPETCPGVLHYVNKCPLKNQVTYKDLPDDFKNEHPIGKRGTDGAAPKGKKFKR